MGSGVHREWKREREVAWAPGGNLLHDRRDQEYLCQPRSICLPLPRPLPPLPLPLFSMYAPLCPKASSPPFYVGGVGGRG